MRKLIDSSKFRLVLILLLAVLVLVFCVVIFGSKGGNTSLESEDSVTEEVEPEEMSHADSLDEESTKEDEGETILFMPKDEVYGFTMTDANGIILEFEKRGEEWVYIDDETLDINETRIDKVLNYLSNIQFINSISTEDGSEYGLSQESRLYILSDGSGSKTFISLGDTNDDGQVYFAINYDFNTVYVNSGKLGKVGDYYIEELIGF